MSQPNPLPGPQFRSDRPIEQEAVRTTIVGGRPPGSGQPVGAIPRGIEVLVKKAAVDPEFKTRLLDRRADAAAEIGLELDAAERMMLAAVPTEQLEAIIARTTVPEEHRRAFLGQTAAAMLAAVAAITVGCERRPAPKGIRPDPPPVEGIRPDPVPPAKPAANDASSAKPADRIDAPRGIRPDLPQRE